MGKKNRKRITIFLVIILILIVVAIGFFAFYVVRNGISLAEEDKEIAVDTPLEVDNQSIEVETSENYVEPGVNTLDIEKIQGFTSSTAFNASESAEGDVADSTDKTAPTITLSDSNLVVEAIGSYSGNFIEDGSDEPTANVAAMLVTNNSNQMLQIAEITFQINESETAVFKVTDLPAGTAVLVLEQNKREFKLEDSYTYGETASGYMEQPTLEEEKFELTTEKGKIILKNKTDQSYDKVYVYYKYTQIGGAYFGGITYRTPFENVPAGGEVEAVASHFNPNSSKIMAVQIQE